MLSAFRSLSRGEASATGTRVRFRERPVLFVVTIIVQLGFGALALCEAWTTLFKTVQGN